jgi:predicted house-cleaning NTP pyrophosphatase (Maf/HAM1 superfamily)
VTFETLSEEDILNYLNSQELTEEELEESVEGSGD